MTPGSSNHDASEDTGSGSLGPEGDVQLVRSQVIDDRQYGSQPIFQTPCSVNAHRRRNPVTEKPVPSDTTQRQSRTTAIARQFPRGQDVACECALTPECGAHAGDDFDARDVPVIVEDDASRRIIGVQQAGEGEQRPLSGHPLAVQNEAKRCDETEPGHRVARQ